jgi:hypothetical protein
LTNNDPQRLFILQTTQTTNEDQRGPSTASPRATIAIAHPERVKQWPEIPICGSGGGMVVVVVVLVVVVFVVVVIVVMVVMVVMATKGR